jgi:hypothetical protein
LTEDGRAAGTNEAGDRERREERQRDVDQLFLRPVSVGRVWERTGTGTADYGICCQGVETAKTRSPCRVVRKSEREGGQEERCEEGETNKVRDRVEAVVRKRMTDQLKQRTVQRHGGRTIPDYSCRYKGQ